jgi:hypothetical protein
MEYNKVSALMHHMNLKYPLIMPQLFITLTHNEKDESLQSLKAKGVRMTTNDPVLSVVHFVTKANEIMKMVKNGLFGRVLGSYERDEFQESGR